MGALQAAHLPPSAIQLATGMFCSAVIGAAHDGQRERGTRRFSLSAGGGSRPSSSAQSARHSACIMIGIRWITTFRKEPITSPRIPAAAARSAGEDWRAEKSIVVGSKESGRGKPLPRPP